MNKISDILVFLEQRAPWMLAESWDNVGLLVGDRTAKLTNIVAGIELSSGMIEYAIETGANLIVTHHPIFFKGSKTLRFTGAEDEAEWVRRLIKNDISLVAMHTNFDRAPHALHSYLFERLDFINCRPLEIFSSEGLTSDKEFGYGIQGALETEMEVLDFIDRVKQVFDLEGVRYSGDGNLRIKSAGFVSGSGMFLWKQALKNRLDIYITGDVKHHDALDAINAGLNVLDVGHFGAEKHFAFVMEKWFGEHNIRIDTYIGRDPFKFF